MKTTKLNRFGLMPAATPEMADKYGAALDKQIEDVSAVLDRLAEKAKRIREDARFTALGRQDELARAGREAAAELVKLTDGPPRVLREHISDLKAPAALPTTEALAKSKGEDTILTYHRVRELRDYLRTVEPLMQRPLLLEAAANNDLDLLCAMSDCHPLLNPVRPALVDEVTKEWLELRLPPQGRVILETIAVYASNVKTAEKVIEKECGIRAAADPLVEAATGKIKPAAA